MMMTPLFYLILVVGVLVGVAFVTLLERKILGYIQIRKGPNKVGMSGIFQPFSDAVKLFVKEPFGSPVVSNMMPYLFSPVFSLFLALMMWWIEPLDVHLLDFDFGMLFFLCCTSMGVYGVLLAGWSSNSKYALLGGLRAVAQTISYEVSLVLILLSPIYLMGSFSFEKMTLGQEMVWMILVFFPLGLVWFASSLAETNRTPFDFAEGESELVSGFNIEYGAGGFAMIFMAEYAMIIFMCLVFSLVFMGGSTIFVFFSIVFFVGVFVWMRGTLPRFRYDKLMDLCWKSFLPLSLNYLFYVCGLGYFFLVFLNLYSWFSK
uniref:NADH-ubiquinone oxidoreductase chain 1 n=1 Tax=Octostigma sinensis TaxID=211997 RepID=U3KTI7_9HEXA|nr:NADH dehydrogenase subunit 1 [Octostigma sinensis]AEV44846.1 NADH dehydrogenase subunit 1 [Octostigma sinensis]